jgi:nitrate/nitrite transporter NarK
MAEASVAHRPPGEASVTELMTQLSTQTSRLVRDEMLLAQKEFQASVKRAGFGAGLFGTAGMLAGTGFLTVVAAAVAALALVLPVWASCLIVAAVLFIAAAVAGVVAKSQVQQVPPAAREVVTSVKTDIDEVKGARRDRS